MNTTIIIFLGIEIAMFWQILLSLSVIDISRRRGRAILSHNQMYRLPVITVITVLVKSRLRALQGGETHGGGDMDNRSYRDVH